MREISRTAHAVNNTIFGILASVVTVVLNLVVRVILVNYLGDQINGLNSLFYSIISVLTLVQMGFSTAMVIHLYKPVQEGNQLLVCQLLNYYKRLYHNVAFLFLFLGILVVCVMDRLVSTTINLSEVRFYFMLFVFSYVANYLTYYKRSLLFAEQKNRISIISTMMSELLFRGFAIILVILFKQYYLFLLMLICDYAISNWLCARYVDRHHPYINKYAKVYLPEEKRRAIVKTIKPLMVNQISDTVQKAAQSILISILLGNVAIVGYYGSYQLITSTIMLLMSQIGGAFTSGFGNLNTINDKERLMHVFFKFFFIVSFIAILLISVTACCIQDIIFLLFGYNFLLPLIVVGLILFISFLTIIGIPVISVQNALGLHKLDSKWMIVQAVSAICLGFVGGKLFGMNGILIGLIVPIIIFTTIGKAYLIIRHVFKKGAKTYFVNLVFVFIKLIFVCASSYIICSVISFNNILFTIIIKGCLGVIISAFLLWVAFMHNPYLKLYIVIVKSKLHLKTANNLYDEFT